MNILFIGDIVGKGGRKTISALVPHLREKYNCSLCIGNVENIAGGAGVTKKCIYAVKEYIDIMTTGDHVWDQKDFQNEIDSIPFITRPANFHTKQPGKGYIIFSHKDNIPIAVINIMGKVFMKDSAYCPFECVVQILQKISDTVKIIIVDFHSEATSEKIAMGRFLDGKVSAVIGTHTHVQTADAQIFPNSTAYITDVGMCGAVNSILGRDIDAVIKNFCTGMPQRFSVVEKGQMKLDAVIIDVDTKIGKANNILPISVQWDCNP